MAYVEARKHFHIPVVDPKWVALGNLAVAVGTVYQPKLAAIAERGRNGAASAITPSSTSGAGVVAPAPVQSDPSVNEWLPQSLN